MGKQSVLTTSSSAVPLVQSQIRQQIYHLASYHLDKLTTFLEVAETSILAVAETSTLAVVQQMLVLALVLAQIQVKDN
jgi:hypothetical protein